MTSQYGLLVVVKADAHRAAGAAGRAHPVPADAAASAGGEATAVVGWVAAEVALMGLAYGVAVAITRASVG